MNLLIQPVILCGGTGTRLWPLSRETYPKQLLNLTGRNTMLHDTILRLNDVVCPNLSALAPILVGNEEYRFLMAEQLRQTGVESGTLFLEPCGRNTAPALTLAALEAGSGGGGADPVLVVMAADHVIQNLEAFREAVVIAAHFAESGQLVTLGVRPQAPETGYGYIRLGEAIGNVAYVVEKFVEKPDVDTAREYLASGRYLWNSGIFVVKASVWLEKIGRFRSDILDACRVAFEMKTVGADFVRAGCDAFAECPSDSIDYAVMEPLTTLETGAVVLVPLDAGWSDVGAWSALWQIGEKDSNGNVLKGDVITVDTTNTLVMSDRLVATVGLNDTVVVETPDAILVANRNQIQKVKEVVLKLKATSRRETSLHRKVYRPWGWYDSIDCGPRFQVKRIVVNPGGVLSLQMHHHRAEHWIVVSGTAKVTKGNETFLVSENESTYIPLGVTHRLENPGTLPLEMIEVQSGSYLGEDDIVRFEDTYGRV